MDNALDMFKGVKIELDQYQSESFDVEDFNFYVNKALGKLLKQELSQFELTQTVTDKIAPLIKTASGNLNATDATDVRLMGLPEDYRHVVSALVRLRYKQATPSNSIGAKRSKTTLRLTGDSAAAILDNYYLKPLVSDSSLRLYHRVIGSNLSIILDTPEAPESKVVIENVLLEYIAEAPEIKISTADGTIEQDTVFPVHFNREIVALTATLFLENNESPRLPTHESVGN